MSVSVSGAALDVERAEDNLLKCKRALREAIQEALEAGVPKTRIAEDAGISRQTLYRYLQDL